VTFVTFSCLNGMFDYDISRANKQIHLDLAALFVLIRPYLKSCCLLASSVAAAISPFKVSMDCSKRNRLLAMHALGIH